MAAASISPASAQILDGVGFAGPYTIEIEGIGGEPEPGLEARQRAHRSQRRAPASLRLFRLSDLKLGLNARRTCSAERVLFDPRHG